MSESSRSDRVAYADSVSDIYEGFKGDGGSVELSPFKTYKDIFMFAVLLGFRKGIRQKLPIGPKKTIRLEVFSREDRDILQAVAIAEVDSLEVLSSFSDIINIAEEYAHTGIYDLQNTLSHQGGKTLWNLVELVNSELHI